MPSFPLERVVLARLAPGSDLLQGVEELCRAEGVRCATVSVIGALRRCRLGWYDPTQGRYEDFTVGELAELLSCSGNVSLLEGQPMAHLHAQLAVGAGPVRGGHLLPGSEVFVAEVALQVLGGDPPERRLDAETGLKLWPLSSSD